MLALKMASSGPHARRFARRAGLLFAVAAGSAAAASLGGATPVRPLAVGVTVAADVRTDARDAGASPLDMLDATLVQREVRMVLRVTTSEHWTSADLTAQPGRAICLMLARGASAVAHGRVCVTRLDGHPALTYTPLTADGTPGSTRKVGGSVGRGHGNVLQATFLPVAADLQRGTYSWWLQTDWTDAGACATTCTDRLPDAEAIRGKLALLGVVPCFGAAARDRERPCRNPRLRLAVEPPPDRAQGILDPFCDTRTVTPISICAFGAAPQTARATFVVIGDSHAASLKTALEVLTLARHWRGVSMLLSACPATRAKAILPTGPRTLACRAWNDAVLAWLAAHPGVDIAFLSTHRTAEYVHDPKQTMDEAARAGYRDEITALLRVVQRVVVIRDTPFDAPGHLTCIEDALGAGRAPGPACARERSLAVKPDPLADAARAMNSDRVKVVDLTSSVCDAGRCYPVVGGALVHRDETHVTPAFSATLGPLILRALKR